MAQIIWASKARKDLASIHAFIAQDSEKYALIVAEEILNRVRNLITYPGKWKIVPEFQNADIRELKVYSYRGIYLIVSQNTIAILKVRHQSRRLKTL